MAKFKKRRRNPDDAYESGDDPLGIGLSKKAMIWVGAGIAAYIVYRAWKAKQAAKSGVAGHPLAPSAPEAPIHNISAHSAPASVPRNGMESPGMERAPSDGRL